MPAPGQPPEHRARVVGVGGLAEDRVLDDHRRVGGEHRQLALGRQTVGHRVALGGGDPADVVARLFAGQRRLVDVRGDDLQDEAQRWSSSRRRGDAEASRRSGSAGVDDIGPGFYHADNLGERRPRTRGMRAPVTLLVPVLLGTFEVACTPQTDLTNVAAAGATPPTPTGPAGATLIDPAAGATGVPLNLAGVVVRFPAAVSWGTGGLVVCNGQGAPVPVSTPAETPCSDGGGGACYRGRADGEPAAQHLVRRVDRSGGGRRQRRVGGRRDSSACSRTPTRPT